MGRKRRFLKIGSWIFLLTAALHTVAHFLGDQEPPDETGRQLHELAKTYSLPGINHTMIELLSGFSLQFSTFGLFVGLVGLFVAGSADERTVRRITWLECAVAGVLTGISALYFPIPPLVLFALAFLCLLVAAASRGPA